jgi:hypothetical protein
MLWPLLVAAASPLHRAGSQHALVSDFASCGVVVAGYKASRDDLSQLQGLLTSTLPLCSVLVYDKTNGCESIPDGMACLPSSNVGHDWNPTYLHHIVTNYDVLPDVLVMIPSKYDEYHRLAALQRGCGDALDRVSRPVVNSSSSDGGSPRPTQPQLSAEGLDFCCVRSREINSHQNDMGWRGLNHAHNLVAEFANLTGPDWAVEASVRPFGRWVAHHLQLSLGDDAVRTVHPCHLSLFAASKRALHARPQSFYANLLALFGPSKEQKQSDVVSAAPSAAASATNGRPSGMNGGPSGTVSATNSRPSGVSEDAYVLQRTHEGTARAPAHT